jgi:hypothetical protein
MLPERRQAARHAGVHRFAVEPLACAGVLADREIKLERFRVGAGGAPLPSWSTCRGFEKQPNVTDL